MCVVQFRNFKNTLFLKSVFCDFENSLEDRDFYTCESMRETIDVASGLCISPKKKLKSQFP